jgi:hypothetical protein
MKISELGHTATESPPIKDEIAALEQQIEYRRERLKSRSYMLEYRARQKLVSPAFLLMAVAGGFLGERYLSYKQNMAHAQRPAHPGQLHGKPVQERKEGLIEKGLKAVTLIQGIMASYPVMMLRKYLDEQNRQPHNMQPPHPQTPEQEKQEMQKYYH